MPGDSESGDTENGVENIGAFAKLARILPVVLIWFMLNISMSNLTKWTYLYGAVCTRIDHVDVGCETYNFPFMITAVHMACSWIVCCIIIHRRQKHGAMLTASEQVRSILPLGIIYSSLLALGNLSLKFIYPSFNQMLASSSPLVTVVMSIILHRKRYNMWTWASMPVICGGLVVCSKQEVNYNLIGVICVVGATVLRAVKSVMQEQLLDPKRRALDSVSLVYFLAPWTGGILVAMSLVFEGPATLTLLLPPAEGEKTGIPTVLLLLLLSGANACFLNISGNQVTAHVGAVMLQVLGNVKACLSIIVSCMIFRNPVTVGQALGVVVCLFGVALYNWKGGTVKASASSIKVGYVSGFGGRTSCNQKSSPAPSPVSSTAAADKIGQSGG